MSTTEIDCEFELCCAHALPRVPSDHKCWNMHGHNYTVTVYVGGDIDPEMGWIVDYDVIERVWILQEMQGGLSRCTVTAVRVKETSRFGVTVRP